MGQRAVAAALMHSKCERADELELAWAVLHCRSAACPRSDVAAGERHDDAMHNANRCVLRMQMISMHGHQMYLQEHLHVLPAGVTLLHQKLL